MRRSTAAPFVVLLAAVLLLVVPQGRADNDPLLVESTAYIGQDNHGRLLLNSPAGGAVLTNGVDLVAALAETSDRLLAATSFCAALTNLSVNAYGSYAWTSFTFTTAAGTDELILVLAQRGDSPEGSHDVTTAAANSTLALRFQRLGTGRAQATELYRLPLTYSSTAVLAFQAGGHQMLFNGINRRSGPVSPSLVINGGDSQLFRFNPAALASARADAGFELVQTIPTGVVREATFFIMHSGRQYLALAVLDSPSKIYPFIGATGALGEPLTVTTFTGQKLAYMRLHSLELLVVVDSADGGTSQQACPGTRIFTLSENLGVLQLAPRQALPICGGQDAELLAAGGDHWLVVPQFLDDVMVYRFDNTSGLFTFAYSLPYPHATDVEPFTINGEAYMAIAVFRTTKLGDTTSSTISPILRFDAYTRRFRQVHALPTGAGPNSMHYFTFGEGRYLALADTLDITPAKRPTGLPFYAHNTSSPIFELLPAVFAPPNAPCINASDPAQSLHRYT